MDQPAQETFLNIRKTLILSAVLIVGLIYAYGVEYRGAQEKARGEETEKKIFGFDPKSVSRLTITADNKVINIVKEKEGWKVTSPVESAGDTSAIDGIIRSAAEGLALQAVEGAAHDFGLEPATMQIDFYHGGKPDTLLIGSPSPTGSAIYIKTSKAGKTMLINAGFANSVAKTLFQLRDKRILHGDAEQVAKIEIKKNRFNLTVEKSDGKWNITSPIKSAADGLETKSLIGRLMAVEAIEFPDSIGEKEAGLATPRLKVAVWIGNTMQEISLGGATKDQMGVYAKVDGGLPIAVLPGAFVRDIPQTAEALRDKRAFVLDGNDVQGINIKRGKEEIALSRMPDGSWKMADSSNGEVDQAKAGKLLFSLVSAGTNDLLSKKDFHRLSGKGEETLISLALKDGGTVAITFRTSADGKTAYGEDRQAERYFTISPAALEEAQNPASFFIDRRIFGMGAAEVGAISIQLNGKQLRIVRDNGTWSFVIPEKKPADLYKVERLISNLTALSYTEKAAADNDKRPPLVTVTLEGHDGTGTKIGMPFFAHSTGGNLLLARPSGGSFVYALERDMLMRSLPEKMEDLL